jgi:predicted extracellular nuclease
MKKTRILLILLTFAVAGFLAACTNVTAQLEEAQADLIANYADSIGSGSDFEVTEDLALVTSIGEATVSWSSSNTAAITNSGVVTRGQDDEDVTLTATLTIDEESVSQAFDVVVPMIPAATQVASAKTALVARYADTIGDDAYNVTNDLSLVTTEAGVTVAWTSSDAAIIATDGSVTRPSYTVGSQTVTLTATLTKGSESDSVVFYAFVVALDKTAEETVNEVFDLVVTFPSNEGLTGSEEWLGTVNDVAAFLASKTYEETDFAITWSSDDADVFAIVDGEGVVTRPAVGEEDAIVTVTATIVYGDVTYTRDYEFKVLAYEAPTVVDSIAAITDAASGDYVQVNGVTVIAIVGTNIFIGDGTNLMYVYDTAIGNNVTVGSVYDVAGVFSPYYGIPELVSATGLPVVATPAEGDAASLDGAETTIAELLEDRTAPSDLNYMVFEYAQLTVKVVVDAQDTNSGSNYNTYLVPTDYEGETVIKTVGTDGKATEFLTDDVLLVYYGSPNKDAVAALDGKTITINVLLFGFRSDRNVWYTYFLGESDDITVHLNDAESIAAAQENLPGEFPEVFYEGETLTLPSSLYDTTITYASSDEAIIDPTTGAVAIPETGQTDVTLTATIAKGDETSVEVAIVVTVGVPANSDISAAAAAGEGAIVMITGVVTAAEYQNTYFIQDSTGGVAIYSYDDDVEAFLQANYGNEISILGSMTSFKDMIQIKPDSDFLSVVNDVDAVMPTAVNLDLMDLTESALMDYRGQLVEISGLYVSEVSSDSYENTYITFVRLSDGVELDMKQDSRVTLSTEGQALLDSIVEGSYVTVVNPLAWANGPYLYFTDTTMVTFDTLSDADAVSAVKALLPEGYVFEEDILEDFVLDLPASMLDVAISWASDNEAVIDLDGNVVVPTDGSQVVVTLTATLTKGDATDEVVLEVAVGETPAITISEAKALLDEEVKVVGVVTAGEYYRTYFIQDATGGVAIYTYDEDVQAFFAANYGNEVKIVGTMDQFGGLFEIVDLTFYAVVDDEAVLPAVTDLSGSSLSADLSMYQGMIVSFDHLYVAEVSSDSYGNVYATLVKLGEEGALTIKFDVRATLSTEGQALLDSIVAGSVFDVTSALAWSYGPYIYFNEELQLVAGTALTDQELAYADALAIEIETSFVEAGTIVLPATGANSTIAWASDNVLIDPVTGAVTLPETASTVEVTLTATVTVNGMTAEQVIVVSVTKLAEAGTPDLFISEYIEGSGSNKAIEIYNGTGVDVDLTDYTLELYSNGGAEASAVYDLTGTLAAGDVFVLANSQSASTEILAEADVLQAYPSVPNFNGDDAVSLSKLGVVIDVIGVIGVDPGSSWSVNDGSTANHTLVRVSSILSPNATFTESEWIAYDQDTFTYIGSHVVD